MDETLQPQQQVTETPRLKALRSLSQQVPAASQKLAQGYQAARDFQLQQAAAKAPAPAAAGAAQQMGTASATQAGQQAVGLADNQAKVQQEIQRQGLQEGQRQAQSQAFTTGQQVQSEEAANRQKIAQLGQDAQAELFDRQMKFQKDELGRTQFNDRQLADYAVTSARSQEQYKNYQQAAQLAYSRNLQVMQTAYNKLDEALRNEDDLRQQGYDQAAITEMHQARNNMQQRIRQETANIANRMSVWAAGGSIVGGVLGGYYGGAGGAAIGSAAGGAVGTTIAAQGA